MQRCKAILFKRRFVIFDLWFEERKVELMEVLLTWISRNFSARTGGPWSIGLPDPLKTLPSISTLIGILRTSPVNSQVVVRLSMPDVPSKIYLTLVRDKWICTYLDNSLLSFDLKDLALSYHSIAESHIDDLSIFRELNVFQHYERTFDILDCSVVYSWCYVVVSGYCSHVLSKCFGVVQLHVL